MRHFAFLLIALTAACGASSTVAPVDDPSDIAAGWDNCSAEIADAGPIVAERESAVNDCYGARTDHGVEGDLTLALHISPNGNVDDTRVAGSLASSDVATCVRRAFDGVRFPIRGGSCGVLVVPYTFHAPPAQ